MESRDEKLEQDAAVSGRDINGFSSLLNTHRWVTITPHRSYSKPCLVGSPTVRNGEQIC